MKGMKSGSKLCLCFSLILFVMPSLISLQFDFECRAHGANFLAYPPVVAGGNRANTLHYISNNQIVKVTEMTSMLYRFTCRTHTVTMETQLTLMLARALCMSPIELATLLSVSLSLSLRMGRWCCWMEGVNILATSVMSHARGP